MDELEELLKHGNVMHRINEKGEKEHIPREKWDVFYKPEPKDREKK